jgi:uncharacterized protein
LAWAAQLLNHLGFSEQGLRHLQDTERDKFLRGVVLYAGREVVPFGDKLWAVPLSVWWG